MYQGRNHQSISQFLCGVMMPVITVESSTIYCVILWITLHICFSCYGGSLFVSSVSKLFSIKSSEFKNKLSLDWLVSI